MRLSIITVNYNGSKDTIKLISSVYGQLNEDRSLIVVDNASKDEDFNELKSSKDKDFPNTKIIRNNDNLGFSGGNNIGIKEALKNGADWVILINNDTWVEDGFVARLKAVLSAKQGIIGIPLIEGDKIAYCGVVEWFKPTLPHLYSLPNKDQYCYTIGGGMAIHKSVFEKIGFLDEKYFLYFEDVDYCLRTQRAEIPIEFANEPKIHHQVSSTTLKIGSPLLLRYHYRNALYFNLKNGPWSVKLSVWPWSIWILIKQVIKIIFFMNITQSLAIIKGVFDFYSGRTGKII